MDFSFAYRLAIPAYRIGLSRRIEAEQWDAVQAGLDKLPTAKAAFGTQSRGTAKPWIRWRSCEQSP